MAALQTLQAAAVHAHEAVAPPRLVTHRTEAPTISGAFRSCHTALWGTAGISFITNLLMLTGPLFMLQIYDRVLASGSVETLVALLVLVTGLFTFMGLLELIRARVLTLVGLRIDRLLGKALFDSVLTVKPALSGSRQTQALRDLEQIRQFAAGPVLPAVFDAPWVPFYFAIIFLFHHVLGMVAVAGAVLLVTLSVLNEVLTRKPTGEASKLALKTLDLAEAGRRNAETLHAMGMAEDYSRRWLDQHRKVLSVQLRATEISGALVVLTRIFRLFLQSLILAAGAYLAIQHEVSAGVMVASSIIMARALAPIEQLTSQWRSILAIRQAIPRIEEQLQQTASQTSRLILPRPQGQLTVSGLYASPLGSQEIILKNLSFALHPGQAVAVVGPSASGKSTLARVLVGVWPVKRGDVRLDGASLEHWDRAQLGRHVGYLPQDIELLRRYGCGKHFAFRPEEQRERHPGGGNARQRSRTDPQASQWIRDKSGGGRCHSFGRTTPAHCARPCALWRSAGHRARRAQCQPRSRRRAGALPRHHGAAPREADDCRDGSPRQRHRSRRSASRHARRTADRIWTARRGVAEDRQK